MRRRKQQAQLQPIGDVLFPLLKKRGLTSKIEENALLKLWPRAVGPQIASKTKPDSLRNGTLFVKTVSSVWVQQLHFVKDDILDKLNQLYEKSAIKEIRFVVGHALEREKAQENASAETVPAEPSNELSIVSTIEAIPAVQEHKPKSLTKKQLEKKFKDELLRVRDKMEKK